MRPARDQDISGPVGGGIRQFNEVEGRVIERFGGMTLEQATANRGETSLMSTVEPPLYTGVAEESQLKNVESLLAAGADVNARDDEGRTILDAAQDDLAAATDAKKSDPIRVKRLQDLLELLKSHDAKSGEPKVKNESAKRRAAAG